MSNHELTATAREYRDIQAEIKALEEQADALKQQMIKHMDNVRADELRVGEYTIRYKLVESSRLDSSALKAAQPEIFDAYTKKTTSTRFQVA